MPLPAVPLILKAAPWILGGVGAWLLNDKLEREGVKAPGETAPGRLVAVAVLGAMAGAAWAWSKTGRPRGR